MPSPLRFLPLVAAALALPAALRAQPVGAEVFVQQALSGPASADGVTPAAALDRWETQLSGPALAALLVYRDLIDQGVAGNLAVVDQTGDAGQAAITQRGLANLAFLQQMAEGGGINQTSILQEGDANLTAVALRGGDNALTVEQIGSGNVYTLDFTGRTLNHSVSQVGNGIRAEQVGFGTAPFSVEQRGNSVPILIEHNVSRGQ